MKILVCPGAFKGTFSAAQVADVVRAGLSSRFDTNAIVSLPLADGGGGSLDVVKHVYSQCEAELTTTVDSLGDGEIAVPWLFCAETETAFIETSKVIGFGTYRSSALSPRFATSFGVGTLIASAISHGAKKILLMLGDTVVMDAGYFCVKALNGRFLNKLGLIVESGDVLERLLFTDQIDLSGIPDFSSIKIILAVDTQTPLCGANGLVRLYGKQKGLRNNEFDDFELAIEHYADVIKNTSGRKVHNFPGASAGGGIAASLIGLLKAEVISGFDYLSELLDLENFIAESDLVITGEGRIDQQTVYGKVPWGVSKICRRHKIPMLAITGSLQGVDASEFGFAAVFETQDEVTGSNIVDLIRSVERMTEYIEKNSILEHK